MKRIFLFALACTLLFPVLVQAQQVSVPQLSPLEKLEVEIGISKIYLEYSRPSMRGRKIFGGLVPYDQLWRTGANVNTQIRIEDPVNMGGKSIAAGTYSLFSIPSLETWTIFLYTELGQYGAPEKLEEDKIVAEFSVPAKQMTRTIESLDIGFDHHTPNSAILVIAWENTYVEIPIVIDTEAIIQQRLHQSTQTLAGNYASSAWIYYRDHQDVEKALATLNQSIILRQGDQDFASWLSTLDPKTNNLPWRHFAKSEMLAELGQFEAAIAAAKQSLAIAQVVNSESYIASNTANIKKWEAALKP